MPTLEEIKAKQQVTWSSGDYGKIAWITQPLSEVMIDAVEVRPGGTIGMVNWRPEGFIGELFRTIGAHVPPPDGLKPAALWGSEERVRELFGDGVSSVSFKDGAITIGFLSPEHFADFFISNYGSTLKASEAL